MNAIIIEDESAAVKVLQKLLREVSPETNIVACLQSIEESVAYLSSEPMPDLIFMDVHLADGS